MNTEFFPKPPEISEELITTCKNNKNFMPIAFEWSKFIGILCIKVASIMPSSSPTTVRNKLNIAILTGLLNRCSRLFLSMIHLASANKFDETIRVISRCLMESLIKIRWLITKENDDSFKRYLRDGLYADYELRKIISSIISDRNDQTLVIEERMLNSIDRVFATAGFTPEDLEKHKKLPNFKQILLDLGYDAAAYVFIQRMGSQSIHGTWSDLMACYLEYDKGEFNLQDNDKSYPKENYFTTNILFALEAFSSYVNYIIEENEVKNELLNTFDAIKDEILNYHEESASSDYLIVEDNYKRTT